MAKESKLSPMMEHYKSVKEKYPDCVVMYRLGDFYEMFFEDAVEVSKILELTLTGRDCGLAERAPMCGIPHHAADGYISKLVQAGKKVAICEQLTAPGDQKGMVKRDVVRVITAGTVTDEDVLPTKENNFLATVVCAQNHTAGVAWLDVSTGETKVTELKDDAVLEDFLMGLKPSEILSPTASAKNLNTFSSVLNGKLPKVSPYHDYYFIYDDAVKTVEKFYRINHISAFGLEQMNLAVSALGGLLQYTESTQKRVLKHIGTPKILRYSQNMYLDYATRKNLELTETLDGQGARGSLLWVLDRTKTNMGARELRQWILEPLLDGTEIRKRLESVECLVAEQKLRTHLGEALSPIRDLERLCSKIAYNTISPRECLGILAALRQIHSVKKLLSNVKPKLLSQLEDAFDPMEKIADLLERAIYQPPKVEDGQKKESEDFMIANGYHAELDEYRNAKRRAKTWFKEYEAREKELTGIKNLKVGYNRVFGYYIEVTNSNLSQVPYYFQRRQTMTGGERFITEDLQKMEDLVLNSEEKARILELKLYQEIKDVLYDAIPSLQRNARALAYLDVIYSFAETSVEHGYVKPKITDKKGILIKGGRHPVVEAIKRRNEFIANDTVLDADCNTMIITGPNMAGKSTYMRQVALITLMAHIGCFVPADSAEICPVDRIFTRVGASDNLAFGQSTFMVEMNEVANILNSATENSLLILDEIGRGTSTLDGLSIAWAIVEQIALKIKAKTLFATHYHELSELETMLPLLKNFHVLIKESSDGIVFLYKIARGSASKSFGIEVAALAGVGDSVIQRAKKILATLEDAHGSDLEKRISEIPGEDAVPTNQIGFFQEDDRYKEIIGTIEDLNLNSITPIQALTVLDNLKKQVELKKNRKGRK